jgi:hypothetical protein
VVVKKLAIRQSVQAAPHRPAAKRPFTILHLWRMTLWGTTAATALLVAVLTTRSEPGSQRMAALFSANGSSEAQVATGPLDPQAQTRKLADAVRGLTRENSEFKSRLAAVEQNVNDITGSVAKQIATVKAETANTWPGDAKPEPITPAIIASIVTPAESASSGLGAPFPSPPLTAPATQPAGEAENSAASPASYGVDVGGALSIDVLRARWLGIRSAHRHLFEGLTPTVVLRQIGKTNRAELRLVVGPLDSSEAAAHLCAVLAPYRLFCQPTAFDSQHIALQ